MANLLRETRVVSLENVQALREKVAEFQELKLRLLEAEEMARVEGQKCEELQALFDEFEERNKSLVQSNQELAKLSEAKVQFILFFGKTEKIMDLSFFLVLLVHRILRFQNSRNNLELLKTPPLRLRIDWCS
jgi:hypothetical protein